MSWEWRPRSAAWWRATSGIQSGRERRVLGRPDRPAGERAAADPLVAATGRRGGRPADAGGPVDRAAGVVIAAAGDRDGRPSFAGLLPLAGPGPGGGSRHLDGSRSTAAVSSSS